MSTRMNVFRKIYNYITGKNEVNLKETPSNSTEYLNIEHNTYIMGCRQNDERKKPYKMLTFNERKKELNNKVKILHKIKEQCSEIDYILELAKDEFYYSPPEVVDYCFGIVERCIMLQRANVDERLWYINIEPVSYTHLTLPTKRIV